MEDKGQPAAQTPTGLMMMILLGACVPVIRVGDDKVPGNFLEPCRHCEVARQPVVTVEQSVFLCKFWQE